MTEKHTELETDRYCIFIEPVHYLSEIFYDVYLWDSMLGEYHMHKTCDDWKDAYNHIKKIAKEYNII